MWRCPLGLRTSFPLCECDRQAVGSHAHVIHRRYPEPVHDVLPSSTPLHNTLQRLALGDHPRREERERERERELISGLKIIITKKQKHTATTIQTTPNAVSITACLLCPEVSCAQRSQLLSSGRSMCLTSLNFEP